MKDLPTVTDYFHQLQRSIKQYRAKKRLQRDRDARANSFEIIDYRKRRAAALKHTRREVGA